MQKKWQTITCRLLAPRANTKRDMLSYQNTRPLSTPCPSFGSIYAGCFDSCTSLSVVFWLLTPCGVFGAGVFSRDRSGHRSRSGAACRHNCASLLPLSHSASLMCLLCVFVFLTCLTWFGTAMVVLGARWMAGGGPSPWRTSCAIEASGGA